MATVYLADDLKHDRKVALKVLRPELGAVLGVERFLAEVKITARLDHPHILALIDSGTAGGLLYIVFLDWTRPESVTLLKATAPDRVQRLGSVAHRTTSMTLSRDYRRGTLGWSDTHFDAWIYRVVKP